MDKKEQWEHFAATGKVEDYLKYKQCGEKKTSEQAENNNVKGESPYARFHQSNGDCYKD